MRYLISAVSSRGKRSSRRVAVATWAVGNMRPSARLTRRIYPSGPMEMTPVGMLSRMASVKRRRESSSRLLASSSCHLIEAAHQAGQLVDGAHPDAMFQIALADLARGMQQRRDGSADLLGEKQGDPGGHEEHEQRDHGHEHQVEGADVAAGRDRK